MISKLLQTALPSGKRKGFRANHQTNNQFMSNLANESSKLSSGRDRIGAKTFSVLPRPQVRQQVRTPSLVIGSSNKQLNWSCTLYLQGGSGLITQEIENPCKTHYNTFQIQFRPAKTSLAGLCGSSADNLPKTKINPSRL